MSSESPYFEHKVSLFSAHAAAPKVLDYGCGRGAYTRALAANGFDVWGVDANGERLAEAQALTEAEGLAHTCRYTEVATTERTLPFDDGFFDSIFASEIIEHVPDMATFISELKRVLRKGGVLYLTTPNGVSYRHVTKNLLWRAESRIPVIESWPQYLPGKEGHIFYWDVWTLYRLMHINGFKYITHEYGEAHNGFRRISQYLKPIHPLRTGLFLVLEHVDPEMSYG
ncbi:MAG: class I SAM-dependent methyltransferase [Actinomycetota bacterium]